MFYDLMIITIYILDLFIKLAFLDGILGKNKRKLSCIPYMAILIAAEVLPCMNGVYMAQINQSPAFPFTVVAGLISMLLILLLTLLYDTAWPLRLFASAFFFLLILMSDSPFATLLENINPEISGIPNRYLSVYVDFGSKLALLLLVLTVTVFWKMREGRQDNFSYNILLCMIPAFTLILIAVMPLKSILIRVQSGKWKAVTPESIPVTLWLTLF